MQLNCNIPKLLISIFFMVFCGLSGNSAARFSHEIDSLQAELSHAGQKDSIEILTEMGRVHYKNEHFKEALENFYNALRLSERAGDPTSKATLTNNIAAIYYKTDDLNRALDYFLQSLKIEQEIGNASGVSKSLNNVAIIYNELGQAEKSLEHYKMALDLKDSLNDEEGKATVYNNMGLVFLKEGNYEKAIDQYRAALKIFSNFGNTRSVANTTGNIARAYMFMKRHSEAIEYARKSVVLADSVGSSLINLDNFNTLYTTYKNASDFEKALFYYEKYEHLKDSLQSEKLAVQLNDVKIKYETERQASENAVLKSENEAREATIRTQKIFFIAVIIILLLVSVLAYALYKNTLFKKRSIKLLEEQNKEIDQKREELEKLNQVKNKIFSIITHEIRSPLNSLIGTVDLLNSGYLSPEEFFKLSRELKQKVNQTSNFLNNIFIWSKAQMQGINLKKEHFFLDSLLNEIIDLLKEQANIKGIEIERNFPKQQNIVADKNLVGIVAKNLVSNAIKFSRKGRKVLVNTYKRGDEIVVEVEDEGIGVAEDIRSRIFGGESITTPGTADEVGTGLGLTLSKMLVEENGGEIWLESETGKGSKFSFSIPLN